MQVWRKYNWNVLTCNSMSMYKKIDTFVSLAASLSPIFTIFTFPLIVLSYFGCETSFFCRTAVLSLWMVVTFAPFATALLVWALDSRDYDRQSLADIPISLLLIPYIFLQFTVNWLALVDEFILNRPSSFIKTGRDYNHTLRCQNSITVFKQI